MFGVYSEIGRLRRVLVHRPDLSLRRLTPENCRKYLFDDVLWVKRARQEHDGFTDALCENGAEVLDLGEMLGEAMADKAARKWLLDRRVSEDHVGSVLAGELRPSLSEVAPQRFSRHLIGGVAPAELPFALP